MMSNEPQKIIQESFMMSFFADLEEELPPFKYYLQFYCKRKKTHKVVHDRMQHQPHLVDKKELFNLDNPRNIEIDHMMDEMGIIISETLLKEFVDENKESFKHLSINYGVCS